MTIEEWQIWLIIAILLVILEIFTPSFLALTIAIACSLASLTSFFGFNFKIQLILFSISLFISFFKIRPFMIKYAHKKTKDFKSNVDALIGKVGKVLVTIDFYKNEGRIFVNGEDWKAESENNEIIESGEKVLIISVNSTILKVKKIN
jgi:membrane protein implicated in regulation of membrane protease activity